jgi:Na+/alanine symporter
MRQKSYTIEFQTSFNSKMLEYDDFSSSRFHTNFPEAKKCCENPAEIQQFQAICASIGLTVGFPVRKGTPDRRMLYGIQQV